MPLIEKRLRAAAGRTQPNLRYVGGAVTLTTSTNIHGIALNALTGGLASAAAAGDLVICTALVGSASDILFSPGLFDVEHADLRQGNLNFAAFSKRLTAADTSISFSTTSNVTCTIAVSVWRGSHATTPIDATPTTAQGSTSGGTDAPSITTVTGSCVVLACGAYLGTTIAALTLPSGMAHFIETSPDANRSLAMAAASVIAPGAYDPPAFGGGTSGGSPAWCAISIPIRPA